MNRYTFIFEFKQGTYISQIVSENIDFAVNQWVNQINNIEGLNLTNEELLDLQKEVLNEEPTPIKGLLNVWCMFFALGKFNGLLNIVLTK